MECGNSRLPVIPVVGISKEVIHAPEIGGKKIEVIAKTNPNQSKFTRNANMSIKEHSDKPCRKHFASCMYISTLEH